MNSKPIMDKDSHRDALEYALSFLNMPEGILIMMNEAGTARCSLQVHKNHHHLVPAALRAIADNIERGLRS